MLEPLLTKLNELRVILASSSKQRDALLRSTNLKYEIWASNFEENLNPKDHTFSEFVERTALGKTQDVLEQMFREDVEPDVIIGCDTMVAWNGKMLGKPKDESEAFQFIKDLSQSRLPNWVFTGLVIWYKGKFHTFTEVTTVHLSVLTDEEILSYVRTGEPMGKAGGYGIQGIASTFVERIEGDGNNVIGLPLCRLCKELKKIVLDQ